MSSSSNAGLRDWSAVTRGLEALAREGQQQQNHVLDRRRNSVDIVPPAEGSSMSYHPGGAGVGRGGADRSRTSSGSGAPGGVKPPVMPFGSSVRVVGGANGGTSYGGSGTSFNGSTTSYGGSSMGAGALTSYYGGGANGTVPAANAWTTSHGGGPNGASAWTLPGVTAGNHVSAGNSSAASSFAQAWPQPQGAASLASSFAQAPTSNSLSLGRLASNPDPGGQFPNSLYGSGNLSGLGMGSLQNLARGGRPGSVGLGGLGSENRGGGGMGPPMGGQPAHSQGLGQGGRLTPTHFSGGGRSMGGLGGHSMGLLQSSVANSRNPLFSRKMGDGPGGAPFDPSDFPSLGGGAGGALGGSGRNNYVGMVKQPADHSSEFQMSNEDFPALPGAPAPEPGGANSILDSVKLPTAGLTPEQEMAKTAQARKGIQTSPDGLVTNIPANMVVDQFGMIGLLTFIRAAETDPNLVSLALGADLTTLGLNLNSEVNLFPTFGGPWADTPCRPQDIDFHVPHEYLTNTAIREKLAPVKLNRYKDDILFYMFYTNVGDVLQMAAAAELYNRDWRYHKEERVWITRAPGMAPSEKTTSYERGTYYFFDVNSWRKVPKEFHLDYDKLEERPSLPSSLQAGPSPGVAGVGGPHPNHPGPLSGSPGPMGGPAQGGPGGLQAVGPPNSGL